MTLGSGNITSLQVRNPETVPSNTNLRFFGALEDIDLHQHVKAIVLMPPFQAFAWSMTSKYMPDKRMFTLLFRRLPRL